MKFTSSVNVRGIRADQVLMKQHKLSGLSLHAYSSSVIMKFCPNPYVLIFLLFSLFSINTKPSYAEDEIITVTKFLNTCQESSEVCLAFVMGVVEGARLQNREYFNSQPFSFTYQGKKVCLPSELTSKELTEIVIINLSNQENLFQYSAVSGVFFALALSYSCDGV